MATRPRAAARTTAHVETPPSPGATGHVASATSRRPTGHLGIRLAPLLLTVAIGVVVATARPAAAFSVLAHQEVVDATWKSTLVPALRARFPGVGADQLEHAHAFAYGGSHIADL